MIKVPRSASGYRRVRPARADYEWYEADGGTIQVHEDEWPTHSPILGPDGEPLEYEPKPTIGFDLRRRSMS